jgi:hydrogenase maturation protease
MAKRTLLVGLGSPHGNDCIGLRIAEGVARLMSADADLFVATTPAALFDRIRSAERLVVFDACLSGASPGTLHRWKWPTEQLERTRFVGSHDLSLPSVLALAEQLGGLPTETFIWGVAVEMADPGSSISPELEAAIPGIVDQICKTLGADEKRAGTIHA